MEADACERGGDVCQGADAIHENPEARQRGRRHEDAVESDGEGEEERGDVAGCLGVRERGGDEVRETGTEDVELDDDDEDEGLRAAGEFGAEDGVVPAYEDGDGDENLRRCFSRLSFRVRFQVLCVLT